MQYDLHLHVPSGACRDPGHVALDLAGVGVSAGPACSSGKVQRSAVLSAMGVDPGEAEAAAIRISLGWNSTQQDIERLIAAWQDL